MAVEFPDLVKVTIIGFNILRPNLIRAPCKTAALNARKERERARRGQMMSRDEKLADQRSEDLQRRAVRLVEQGEDEEKEDAEGEIGEIGEGEGGEGGGKPGTRTKEGEEEALRFFRARDFETCLSALKSREIKEPRPKPGGRDRATGQGEEETVAAEGMRSRRRRTEHTKDGPTDQKRSPAKSSSPFVHASRFPLAHSFLRSSYSCSSSSSSSSSFPRFFRSSFSISPSRAPPRRSSSRNVPY